MGVQGDDVLVHPTRVDVVRDTFWMLVRDSQWATMHWIIEMKFGL